MQAESPVMTNDVAVLAQVIEDHDLAEKRLAGLLNVHKSTVYDWLKGERTAPMALYRLVYELTGDHRLSLLLTGTVPATLVIHIERKHGEGSTTEQRIPPLCDLLPTAVTAAEKAVAGIRSLALIVADGKINQADAAYIASLTKDAAEAQRQLALVIAGVEAHKRRGNP